MKPWGLGHAWSRERTRFPHRRPLAGHNRCSTGEVTLLEGAKRVSGAGPGVTYCQCRDVQREESGLAEGEGSVGALEGDEGQKEEKWEVG